MVRLPPNFWPDRRRLRRPRFPRGAYDHRTSRAGDPQLHTHVLVANAIQSQLPYGVSKIADFAPDSPQGARRRSGVRLRESWGDVVVDEALRNDESRPVGGS